MMNRQRDAEVENASHGRRQSADGGGGSRDLWQRHAKERTSKGEGVCQRRGFVPQRLLVLPLWMQRL